MMLLLVMMLLLRYKLIPAASRPFFITIHQCAPLPQDTLRPIFSAHAAQPKTLLRHRRPALHHLQWLWETAHSRRALPPRFVLVRTGTDAQSISIRRRRLCDHARTHSPSHQRTTRHESLDRNASSRSE